MKVLIRIREESPGFGEVANKLATFFAEIDRDWCNKVMRPAVAANFTVLYQSHEERRRK